MPAVGQKMFRDFALSYILMTSVETTDKRFKVEVPSTVVIDIHRGMKSHVTVPLRRQAPCPRNGQCRSFAEGRVTTNKTKSDCQQVVGTSSRTRSAQPSHLAVGLVT